jgi:hypothetical protein
VVVLSDTDRAVLEASVAGYTSLFWLVQRARIVLLAADDVANVDFAGRLGVDADTVSKWRKRFFTEGLAGLKDRHRSGRPVTGGGTRWTPTVSCFSSGTVPLPALSGDGAVFKKVFLADRRDKNGDGKLDKTLVVDLLDIANPDGLGGFGPVFRFPFFTIEGLVLLDARTIGMLNDNNYPSDATRTPGRPDDNEFIRVRLPQSLHPDPRVLR